MSENNITLTGIVLSAICVYVTVNAPQAWAWATALEFWEIPAKIALIAAFVEGALVIIVLFLVVLGLLLKGSLMVVDRVTP